jgi:hypothetical protein
MLTVHSARSALASGQEDFLIVQNVLGTSVARHWCWCWLSPQEAKEGARRTSVQHAHPVPGAGALLRADRLCTPFPHRGAETFYRFGMAAMTGQGIILVAALALFFADRRNNWPYLFAASSFFLGEAIKALLTRSDLIDPLTRVVGTPGEASRS